MWRQDRCCRRRDGFPSLRAKGQEAAPAKVVAQKCDAVESAEFAALQRLDVLTPRLLRIDEDLLPLSRLEALWAWHGFAQEELRPSLVPFVGRIASEDEFVLVHKGGAEKRGTVSVGTAG